MFNREEEKIFNLNVFKGRELKKEGGREGVLMRKGEYLLYVDRWHLCI